MNSLSKKQVTTLALGRETIELRTYDGETGLIIERESSARSKRDGDVRVTQVLLANQPNISGFLDAEPYPEVGPIIRHLIRDVALPAVAANDDGGYGRSREDVLDLIAELPKAADESVLIKKTQTIVRALGAEVAFFFLTEKGANGEHESYRILVISETHVAQTYVERRWYATDPFLTHAAISQAPYFSSDVGELKNLSGSRREMGEFARQIGFGSWIVLPTHVLETNKFGALYAANSRLPADGGEEPLRANWRLFKLLSADLLDWYVNQEKAFAQKSTHLTTIEFQILNARARGENHELIAEALDISIHALTRQYFRSINTKLNAKTIDEAVRIAGERGLLAYVSERKVCYVVYSPKYGVFLRREGSLGTMQFWSSSPYEIDDAEIFPDAQSAQSFIDSLEPGFVAAFHRVEVHYMAQTASIAECVASGLPAWDPGSLTSGAPPDDSGTWGDLNEPPSTYQ
jgi:DNA-binding CsgD family transcriptional regulator